MRPRPEAPARPPGSSVSLMSTLTVRRLLVDLRAPFARHWCGEDAFRTALFNALSMSFPVGEQFFIDAVRAGADRLAPAERERFRAEVQGFVGQEATHRHLHGLFNGHLASQGYVNDWEGRARARIASLQGLDPRHALAITAANEHFTALLADWLLRHPEWLDGAEPRLRTLWLWHCAEESEHRSTAFDLYLALGGNLAWRRRWFRRVTFFFLGDAVRQTVANLRRDRLLWRWRTWAGAARFLLGRGGLVRESVGPWYAYLRRDFHPRQLDGSLGEAWLSAHESAYVAVRGDRV